VLTRGLSLVAKLWGASSHRNSLSRPRQYPAASLVRGRITAPTTIIITRPEAAASSSRRAPLGARRADQGNLDQLGFIDTVNNSLLAIDKGTHQTQPVTRASRDHP
jgi:hypothetical protein